MILRVIVLGLALLYKYYTLTLECTLAHFLLLLYYLLLFSFLYLSFDRKFITKFAILQEQSFTKYERHKTEQLLVLHSAKHMNDLKQLLSKYHKTTGKLKSSIGLLLF